METIEDIKPENIAFVYVGNKEDLERAVFLVKKLKDLRTNVIEYWSNPKKQAHDAWKSIVAKEKEMLDRLDGVIQTQNNLITTFVQEEEKRKQELERQAKIQAEKEAEIERKRLESLAKKEEKKGNLELAESLRLEKESVFAITQAPIESAVDTTNGVHSRQELSADVTNLDAFVKALVSHGYSLQMLDVKKAVLKSWVKSNGIKNFPGLSITIEKKAVIR